MTKSLYIDVKKIANHLHFRTLTRNICLRHRSKVEINVTINIDKITDFK
jgi:hypothetical protein